MSLTARIYVSCIIAMGATSVIAGAVQWQSHDLVRFFCFCFTAMLCSTFKVSLPGITGTMSVNFLFILISISDFSFAETSAIGCAATLVQCLWKTKSRPKLVQVLFSLASMAVAIAVSHNFYHSQWLESLRKYPALLLGLTSICFFITNTAQVAVVIALVERKSVVKLWKECYFWWLPYYLMGAAIATVISMSTRSIGWYSSIVILPPIYIIYRSYRLYLGKLEDEKLHA